jgi:hypothetical protein
MPEPSGKKKLAPYAAEDHRVSEPASTFLPDYSVAIVESVREPLVLLDAGLRVLVANAAFYRPSAVLRTSFGGGRCSTSPRGGGTRLNSTACCRRFKKRTSPSRTTKCA